MWQTPTQIEETESAKQTENAYSTGWTAWNNSIFAFPFNISSSSSFFMVFYSGHGVLLRMRDRSADVVFHLAILGLSMTWQTLIVFSLVPAKFTGW